MSKKKTEDEKIGNVPPFGLRMLPDLKDRIASAAAESGRSMNAEIVRRLELSFDTSSDSAILSELQALRADLERLNLAKFVEMTAKAGNHINRLAADPVDDDETDGSPSDGAKSRKSRKSNRS